MTQLILQFEERPKNILPATYFFVFFWFHGSNPECCEHSRTEPYSVSLPSPPLLGLTTLVPSHGRSNPRFQRFMEEHSPHMCVVGASSMDCNLLRELLLQTVFKIIEDTPLAIPDGLDTIQCFYADPAAAALWGVSPPALRELKEHSPLVRRAVGLARCLQDPMATFASLFEENALLSLPIVPLQVQDQGGALPGVGAMGACAGGIIPAQCCSQFISDGTYKSVAVN